MRLAQIAGLEGRRVASAEAALAALASLPEQTVVLVDIQLGRRSGIQLIETLRQRGDPHPVVLMSGAPPTMSRERIRALGIATFLAKPFGADQLKLAVKRGRHREQPVDVAKDGGSESGAGDDPLDDLSCR